MVLVVTKEVTFQGFSNNFIGHLGCYGDPVKGSAGPETVASSCDGTSYRKTVICQ